MDLSDTRKALLLKRQGERLANIEFRSARDGCIYNFFRIFVTIGSLLIPALISIHPNGTLVTSSNENEAQIWTFGVIQWISWFIGVGVSIANGLISLFSLDRVQYEYSTTKARLRSEFFQQAQLTGRYSGQYLTPDTKANHENQFTQFANEVEKILMSLLEEEQIRAQNKNSILNRFVQSPKTDTRVEEDSNVARGGDEVNVPVDVIELNMAEGVLFPHTSSKLQPPTPADHARARRRGSRKKRANHHNPQGGVAAAAKPKETESADDTFTAIKTKAVKVLDMNEPVFDISALRTATAPELKPVVSADLNVVREEAAVP